MASSIFSEVDTTCVDKATHVNDIAVKVHDTYQLRDITFLTNEDATAILIRGTIQESPVEVYSKFGSTGYKNLIVNCHAFEDINCVGGIIRVDGQDVITREQRQKAMAIIASRLKVHKVLLVQLYPGEVRLFLDRVVGTA